MANKRLTNMGSTAHFEHKPTAIATIRSPGIDVPIEPPAGMPKELDKRFAFLAREGIGRYKQEDAVMVADLAGWEGRLAKLMADKTAAIADIKTASNQVMKLREKLGALPPQRFSQASRQRGAEHYTRDGAARSPMDAAIKFAAELAESNGSDSQEASALG